MVFQKLGSVILALTVVLCPLIAQATEGTIIKRVNLREGPGKSHRAVAVLDSGESVTILSQEGSYAKVSLASGVDGYVSNNFVVGSTADQNSSDETFFWIYMTFSTFCGMFLVRPPMMRWYSRISTFSRGSIIGAFFEAIVQRLTWEAFVLIVAAIVGACGGWIVTITMLVLKMRKSAATA